MKALKYGLTLVLGLGMLGCGAQAFAQASSKQTKKVASATVSQPSSENMTSAMVEEGPSPIVAKEPDRGIPMPQAVENLLGQRDFTKAIEEFEKFIATSKGDPCDLLYLPYTFYGRLMWMDTSRVFEYQKKQKYYMSEYQKKCENTVEAYLMKDQSSNPRIPDSTIVWITKAIEIDSSYAMLYSVRGEALWQLQRKKEACADFEKAVELNNDSFAVEFYRSNCRNLPEEIHSENTEN